MVSISFKYSFSVITASPHFYLSYLKCQDAFSILILKYSVTLFPVFSFTKITVYILILTLWIVIQFSAILPASLSCLFLSFQCYPR